MKNDRILKPADVSAHLKEALTMFCDTVTDLRPALREPFRQGGLVMASEGHILVCVRPRAAGCTATMFRKMDKFNALKVIPPYDGSDMRTLKAGDLEKTYRRICRSKSQDVLADIGRTTVLPEALPRLAAAMRVCGAMQARLVYHTPEKLMLCLDNAGGRDAVLILHTGCTGYAKGTMKSVAVPTAPYGNGDDVTVDWRRGIREWARIKADREREEEEALMARRDVYMVRVIQVGHIPVYARDAEEALSLADKHFIEPENADGEWMIDKSVVPDVEDAEYVDEKFRHCITRDGVVDFDDIFGMEQVREEYMKRKEGAV